MDIQLITLFAPIIKSLSVAELVGSDSLYEKLRMSAEGDLSISYVPFEAVNLGARVVIVGITPGKTQLVSAIREARRQLDLGASFETVLTAAKATGAFSGSMRPNLIALLDTIGLHQHLGLYSCDQLFGTHSALVQNTSALRNAVFLRNANYNGTPNMLKTPFLKRELLAGFANEARQFSGAVFVPLGAAAAGALSFLSMEGIVRREQLLDGLPHPGGANAERIAYFLGRKRRDRLSVTTDPNKLELAKASVTARVNALGTMALSGASQ